MSHVAFNRTESDRNMMAVFAGGNTVYLCQAQSDKVEQKENQEERQRKVDLPKTQILRQYVLSGVNPEQIDTTVFDILFADDVLYVATNFGVHAANFQGFQYDKAEKTFKLAPGQLDPEF